MPPKKPKKKLAQPVPPTPEPQLPPLPPPPTPAPPTRAFVMIPRIGNIQALIEMRGEGTSRQPTVRFVKLLRPDQKLEEREIYSAEDVATLRQLCDNILDDLYRMQSIMINPNVEAAPKPGTPIGKL
jgi:hypothetical protein